MENGATIKVIGTDSVKKLTVYIGTYANGKATYDETTKVTLAGVASGSMSLTAAEKNYTAERTSASNAILTIGEAIYATDNVTATKAFIAPAAYAGEIVLGQTGGYTIANLPITTATFDSTIRAVAVSGSTTTTVATLGLNDVKATTAGTFTVSGSSLAAATVVWTGIIDVTAGSVEMISALDATLVKGVYAHVYVGATGSGAQKHMIYAPNAVNASLDLVATADAPNEATAITVYGDVSAEATFKVNSTTKLVTLAGVGNPVAGTTATPIYGAVGFTFGTGVNITPVFKDSSGAVSDVTKMVGTTGKITVDFNTVLADTAVYGNITVPTGVTLTIADGKAATVGTGAKLTINEGATASITDGETLNVNGTLVINGTLTSEGAANNVVISENGKMTISGTATNAKINNGGVIAITAAGAKLPAVIAGNGSIDTSAAGAEGELSGTYDTTTSFSYNQIITATGDVTLVTGTVFTFNGKLIIPEGVTLTIEDGAQIIFSGQGAYLENNGTIIIASDVIGTKNGGFIFEGQTLKNNGTITLDYELLSGDTAGVNNVMNLASGDVINNGTITAGENSLIVFGDADTENFGTIQMNGYVSMTGGNVENSGLISIDGMVKDKFHIDSASIDAEVQVISLENAAASDDVNFLVTDKDVFKDAKDYNTDKYNKDRSAVDITIKDDAALSGIVITVESEKINNVIYKYMAISGNVVSSTTADGVTTVPEMIVALLGDNVVSGDLVLGENVSILIGFTDATSTVYVGKLIVTGTVTGGKNSTVSFGTTTGSSITVDGKVTLLDNINGTTINAAYYEIDGTTTTNKQYVYTSFETAVADGAKKIALKGTNDLETTLEVPAGVTVTNEDILNITADGKLTFATGSVLKQSTATINVKGVMTIDDLKGTKNPATITSDVIISGENTATYCGLAYALGIAQPGETVKLSNTVTIENSVDIPAGVTLDTNGFNVQIAHDVVLTVNGKLLIAEDSTVSVIADIAENQKIGKVVLNGTIQSVNNEIVYNTADKTKLNVVGAYYSIVTGSVENFYIEPVETAAPKIAEAEDSTMTLYGELTFGNVTFKGTADEPAQIIITDKVTAKSITLNEAAIRFADGKEFSGTITNGVGTVVFAGKTGANATIAATVDTENVNVLAVVGTYNNYDADSDLESVFTVSGDVSLGVATVTSMTVDGKLTVAGNATVTSMVINGSVVVDNLKTLTVTDVEVYGTLAGAEKTTDKAAGKIIVKDMYVGISKKTVTGAAASVTTGDYTINGVVYVADGSTVSDAVIGDEEPTLFIVEGKNYMTVYDFTTTGKKISEIGYKVENAQDNGWVDEDGKSITGKNIGDVDKVYANIDYNVYNVYIMANAGVENVSVDGNLLLLTGYGYYAKNLTAGKHTISYTLANGYSGTASLAVNGTVPEDMECTLSGLDFNVSGDFDKPVTLQLTGIEKSGYVPDSPDNDNSGMTITDYLLIVLVVLIVVMAIIVAMRMMRS